MTHDVTPDGKLVIEADDKEEAFDLASLAAKLQAAGADYLVEREDGVKVIVKLGLRPGPKPKAKREPLDQARISRILGSEMEPVAGATYKGVPVGELLPRPSETSEGSLP